MYSWFWASAPPHLALYPLQLSCHPGVHYWSIGQGTSITKGHNSYQGKVSPSSFWADQWSSRVTLAGILPSLSGTDHVGGDLWGGVESVGDALGVGDGGQPYFIKNIWLRSRWVESAPPCHKDLPLVIVLGRGGEAYREVYREFTKVSLRSVYSEGLKGIYNKIRNVCSKGFGGILLHENVEVFHLEFWEFEKPNWRFRHSSA